MTGIHVRITTTEIYMHAVPGKDEAIEALSLGGGAEEIEVGA